MKRIPLTQNKFALVDDEDFKKVNQYKWYFNGVYAVRRLTIGYKYIYQVKSDKNRIRKTIKMERFILDSSDDNKTEIDHIDFNTLNNQRNNLRVCTERQNTQHRRKSNKKKFTSIYKGVRLTNDHKRIKKWQSSIVVDGEFIHLGRFITQKEAAHVYNEAAKKYFGVFAELNSL